MSFAVKPFCKPADWQQRPFPKERTVEKIKIPIRQYWNTRSRTYGLDTDKSDSVARTWEAVLMALASKGTGRRALDVGTGTGQFAVYLAKNGFQVTGVDLSDEMIACAKANARREGLNIDFKVGDAEHLGFADNSFDVIVSRNLLWTLPYPEKALTEWKRVLKPGGRLVVSDGYWMNSTWRQLPSLALKAVKDKFRDRSRQSLRFFWSYSAIRKSLPYYSGLNVDDATALLEKICFREVGCYDTSCFSEHPYRSGSIMQETPPFFIVYAGK